MGSAARAAFALAAWALCAGAAEAPCAEEGCQAAGTEADEGSMLVLRSSPSSRASQGRAPVLDQPNYGGQGGFWCIGINAVGFDLDPQGGRNGYYLVPNQTAIKYFHDQGANCFRLPLLWERMQTDPNTEIWDPVDGVEQTIDYITQTLGDYVIIDPHQGLKGFDYNGTAMNKQRFGNLWKAIAGKFGSNPRIIFGLFNEPAGGKVGTNTFFFDPNNNDYSGTLIQQFTDWMQSAIDKIRQLNAVNIIMVPGLKFSGCQDWGGNGWWGEPLDGVQNAGNTRLASLTDPMNLIVYDVHQFLSKYYDGLEEGCEGYDENGWAPGSPGASHGLDTTIAWAQKYNKKFFMSEFAAFSHVPDDGTNSACKDKVSNFLQRMHDSGVFIGFTVWQMGCPDCLGDQYDLKPYNLDWYRWSSWIGANIALGKPIRASSKAGKGLGPKKANDGKLNTRWLSDTQNSKERLEVDLEGQATLSRIDVYWDNECAKAYKIRGSTDGQNFSVLQSVSNPSGATGLISTDLPSRPTVSHVQLVAEQECLVGSGYSVQELEVYGSYVR